MMDFHRHYQWMQAQRPEIKGPHGWIQWKGTKVCIDLHCKCGHHGHLDDDFTYYYECPECKTLYALRPDIDLIELDEENAAFVRTDRPGVIKTPLEADSG